MQPKTQLDYFARQQKNYCGEILKTRNRKITWMEKALQALDAKVFLVYLVTFNFVS